MRASPPPAKGPLVLLLGCSTTFAEMPFLNFVQGFNLKGAPIVIGTLSIIHGTQAALLAEIAEDLAVSVNTVKSHVRAIYGKLGVNTRRTAVLTALERGLLT